MNLPHWFRRIHWPNSIFLIVTPILAVTLTPISVSLHGLQWGLVAFFFIYAVATNLAVTAGYHRFFAHRSYKTSPAVKLFYLILGAGAVQGPVLRWASEHRRHHRVVDSNDDPYSIKKGFFYAHIGWLFLKQEEQYENNFETDLASDKLVRWQYDNYVLLATLMSFGLPTLVGWYFGNPWGGLIVGGILRVVFTQHCTFLINSLCHMMGTQPYNDKNSAKDNFVLAVLTCGEGYHNFHHRFSSDYRNGIRWYHWDPTKWWIRCLAFLGLASHLKRIPAGEILKARMLQDQYHVLEKGVASDTLNTLKIKIEEAQQKIKTLREEYSRMKRNMQAHSRRTLIELRAELKVARLEFKMACAQWGAYTKTLRALPA